MRLQAFFCFGTLCKEKLRPPFQASTAWDAIHHVRCNRLRRIHFPKRGGKRRISRNVVCLLLEGKVSAFHAVNDVFARPNQKEYGLAPSDERAGFCRRQKTEGEIRQAIFLWAVFHPCSRLLREPLYRVGFSSVLLLFRGVPPLQGLPSFLRCRKFTPPRALLRQRCSVRCDGRVRALP